MLDFEKAFDSIEWPYLNEVLKKINFGTGFRDFIKLCYFNVFSTVLNNGYSCGWFSILREVRQGCPLSCILFILCVEVLAQLIRECKDIKGIRLGNQEIKISLFADDATCVLKHTDSLRYLFSITDIFCEYSGLKTEH